MHKIWFERSLPVEHSHLLNGVGEFLGPSTSTPSDPFCDLPMAVAIIAAGKQTYDGDVMDLAPSLKAICRTGIGFDNIDISAATRRGIAVCNAPDAPTVSTAEHAIALMFAVAKEIHRIERELKSGGRPDYFNVYNGIEICGLRMGLVGLGRIGRQVANMARGVGMEVCAHDPGLDKVEISKLGIQQVNTLDELLGACDVISLHVPLNPETRNLLDAERLAIMKRGSILINTARGGLIDENALYQALASGHLRGAGLDVFESEPPEPNHPLFQLDNVVATPHIAAATGAAKSRLWKAAIEQAIDVLEGRRPRHLVNDEIWGREENAYH